MTIILMSVEYPRALRILAVYLLVTQRTLLVYPFVSTTNHTIYQQYLDMVGP